jgi:hypothetical protein
MSGFKLRLDSDLMGQELRHGAVARIYRIDEEGVTQSRGARSVTIPAGSGYEFQTIDADPGHYFIEAKLPSGEILSEQVRVMPNADPLEVRLRGSASAHEWQSWQHFAGNVGSIETYDSTPRKQMLRGFRSLFRTASTRPSVELVSIRLDANEDRSTQWSMLAESINRKPENGLWSGLGQSLNADNSDDMYQSFVVSNNSAAFPSIEPSTCRRFLTVRLGDEQEIVTLPFPWRDLSQPYQDGVADVLVRDEIANATAFRSTVTIRDTTFGSALSFMTASGLESAGFLFDQAKDLLFQKAENPLAAAAGAYVLVSNQHEPKKEVWHDWIRNLMNFFPWLPDGAIQYGRLKLRDEESDGDVEEGRAALFSAYRRGLPFFSAGVRWLLSGLTVLADGDDSEAEQMMRIVHRVSLRTDMSQPFTVIRLGQRSK